MPTPEAAARRNIDAALQSAGWYVQDFAELNLAAGLGVAVREFPLARGHGKADYALYVAGKLAGVVEACSGCHCRGDCGRPACGPGAVRGDPDGPLTHRRDWGAFKSTG